MTRESRPTVTNEFKLALPKLPRQLEAVPVEVLQLHDEQTIEQGLYENGSLSGCEANKVLMEKVHFKHVVFEDMALPGVEITDAIFEHCDLSNANWSEAIIHRATFLHCKMVGLDLLGSTLRNVRFSECLAEYATLRFANLKQVEIELSSFAHADFYSATLSKIRLEQNNIDKAQFSSTPLNGIDISTCEFHNLGVTMEDLQGCIISAPQAILFTKIFGLVVKEE
ncbi:hypothetical protein ASD24_14015 [Paenibacillus sp. Root52]|uniref:pentapeptide repeat-containing protein n=1 Tax=Paenibacillus sp. Root52 TaxID=1736552 RepID=UPI0006FC2070|nr:pentapeptide repeat-containing protein [Paenibacillus sp. Root52]KQY83383.1 hypothetical protein ASD24_14015 [Paenibacillus sp. Root52]